MRVAAIDQGTTSTRCLVVEDGVGWRVVASCRHAQHYPASGWVEHDAEELLGNIRKVLEAAGSVDAIGLANQGESCLAWDALTGKPLSPVMVWQDARTSAELAELAVSRPDAEQRSRQICGLPLDPYFSASKLGWAMRQLPEVAAAQRAGRLRLGTTDAFFLDRLCGVFATDVTTASRTGLMDLERGAWSTELCELYGVPMECLPQITAVDAGLGDIAGIPLQVSIVDQQAALYGHGCREPGDCKITFGTGAFLLAVAGPQPVLDSRLLPTVAWQRRGQQAVYAVEGGVYDAGTAIEWARSIGLFDSFEQLAAFEGPSALSRGLAFVPAFSGLAVPWWDRQAAPLFIGMQHATDRRDMARAVLEGIAMLTAGLIDEVAGAVPLGAELSIDGGLSQSPSFARFLASACGRTIRVPRMHELTAMGLAGLCGVDIESMSGAGEDFAPDDEVSDADRQHFAQALERARGWRRQD